MKNQNSPYVERLIHEMQLRNYSSRTVNSYSSLLSKIESFYHLPFDQISTQQLKDYVLQRITNEEISTSMINQYISAYKIMQVDVLKRLNVTGTIHFFATHLLEKGVNLKIIQQFMGHVSIKTTSGYLHLANVNPSSIVSPLDSMNL